MKKNGEFIIQCRLVNKIKKQEEMIKYHNEKQDKKTRRDDQYHNEKQDKKTRRDDQIS
jgi:hypothetical protein